MTKEKYESCIVIARSFINEFITENNLNKKRHSELFELNKKIGSEISKIAKLDKQFMKTIEKRVSFVLRIMEKNVETINKSKNLSGQEAKEVEANKLAFGLSFIFLLIEHNMFKGSQMMYYKRVANSLFGICEKESSKEAISNANKLIHMFDEQTK